MEFFAILAVGLAIAALVRSRRVNDLRGEVAELTARIERIEDRLARARSQEAQAAATGSPPEPAPRPAVLSTAPPVVEAEPLMRPAAPGGAPKAPPAPTPVPAFTVRPPSTPASTTRPPSAPVTPRTPAPALSPPSPPIDWERWVGIRGAAVLGAIALGLAGLLFFRYSIEHGLVTPLMRVMSGTLTGLGCLVGSEWLRHRAYRTTAEAVSGAGIVILYAAFWAAHLLYHLIGLPLAFGLMVLVTVTASLLALRHASLLVAVLGLAGGFATPLLLSSGADRPIGLFGYVLMLDLGMLFVGGRRRWPSLGLLCLLGTTLMQALWIGARMGPDRLALGLVVVGLFAFLFVVAGQRLASRAGADADGNRLWGQGQMAAILVPFAFALYFAARVTLTERLYPIAILLALLVAGAGWVARGREAPALLAGATAASVAILGVFMAQHALLTPTAWELAGAVAALAVITHLFVEIDPLPHGERGPAPAALVAAFGGFGLLIVGAARADLALWPWLAGWLLLAGLLYRHAQFPRRAGLQIAAAAALAIGLSMLHMLPGSAARLPAPGRYLTLLLLLGLLVQAAALLRRRADLKISAEHAAAILPVILLLGLASATYTPTLSPALALGSAAAFGLLAAFAATRSGAGGWYAAAAGATLALQAAWTAGRQDLANRPEEVTTALLVEAFTVVVFTLWPVFAGARFAGSRPALYAAALAGPFWFPPLRTLYLHRFGDAAIGLLPLLLGGLALTAAARARRLWPAGDARRGSALAWFAAVAISFVALAIPLQLEKEWITLGWALEGLALIALWTRLDHPGLKWFALALLGAASARLIANPAILGYYPRSSMRVVNWLLYTYLIPAAALLGSAALLKPLEVGRARDAEHDLYRGGHAVGAAGAGFAAIAVVFVWINLAISDWYATGTVLTLSFGEQPAQRLTVSIAWALYALILLGAGMARRALALRWISLAFLLVTIGKVFLYDLGALKDLYRVASLVGLALSLILVSLLYQRFVFRDARGSRA